MKKLKKKSAKLLNKYWPNKNTRLKYFFLLIILCLPLNFCRAADLDTDADGLSDQAETAIYHTDPALADTDADGYKDGEEITNGYSPRQAGQIKLKDTDSDKDGLNDALEISLGTDLLNPDTDTDSYKDGEEVANGYNPIAGNRDRSWPRRAEVDLSLQKLYYFFNNVKIGEMPVSTGLKKTPTPIGDFTILAKKPKVNYQGANYSYPNTKWNLMFKNGYYLHGAYWHQQFGVKPMSHGCVNIAYADVEKLYKFMDVGDAVVIYGQTPTKALKK